MTTNHFAAIYQSLTISEKLFKRHQKSCKKGRIELQDDGSNFLDTEKVHVLKNRNSAANSITARLNTRL